MRLFVAVPLPEAVRDALAPILRRLSALPGVKAVERENLHITLKFLGEVDERKLEDVVGALRTVQFIPPTISVSGVGAFPSPSRPRVLWAGVTGGEALRDLAARVESALAPLGFRPEARPFHPHVTLARVKGAAPDLSWFFSEYAQLKTESFVVNAFVLFKSTLTPRGPIYEEIARFAGVDI